MSDSSITVQDVITYIRVTREIVYTIDYTMGAAGRFGKWVKGLRSRKGEDGFICIY